MGGPEAGWDARARSRAARAPPRPRRFDCVSPCAWHAAATMAPSSRTRGTHGVAPVIVARVRPQAGAAAIGGAGGGATALAARSDVVASRNRVTLVKPGATTGQGYEEHELDYCYGPEATSNDIYRRTLEPIVRRVVDGVNATVLTLGSTGSGKTHTLEGAPTAATGEEGVIVRAVKGLFEMLHTKARSEGERTSASGTRVGREYEYEVETHFVEILEEKCRDLYAPTTDGSAGTGGPGSLSVSETAEDGFYVANLSARECSDATSFAEHFAEARRRRDTSETDMGLTQERTAALLTVRVRQVQPPGSGSLMDKPTRLVSTLTFVDTPGSERLGMDPEVLRLREGPTLNKGLLALGRCIRSLSDPSTVEFADPSESILTSLLGGFLGGNSLAVVVATLRGGDYGNSTTTMGYVERLRRMRTFPVRNGDEARGLLRKLRAARMHVQEARRAEAQRLEALAAEGIPGGLSAQLARVHDLEGQLLAERESNATLQEEQAALQGRIARLREQGDSALGSTEELQAALVRSEEGRLEVSKVLIELEMEYTRSKEEADGKAHRLEERVLQLEAEQLERAVRSDADSVARNELETLASSLTAERDEKVAELEAERLKLAGMTEEREAAVRMRDKLSASTARAEREAADLRQRLAADQDVVKAAIRDRERIKEEERIKEGLLREKAELEARADAATKEVTLSRVALDDARGEFRRQLMQLLNDVGELSRNVQGGSGDGNASAGVNNFHSLVESLVSELSKQSDVSTRRHDNEMDEREKALVEARRAVRALKGGYRDLRYRLEDLGAANAVPHEDEVAHTVDSGAGEAEEATRRGVAALREHCRSLEQQLNSYRIAMVTGKPTKDMRGADVESVLSATRDAKQLAEENEALRKALDRMRTHGAHTAAGAGVPAPAGAIVADLEVENKVLQRKLDVLLQEDPAKVSLAEQVVKLKDEIARKARGGGNAGDGGDGDDLSYTSLRKQMKEFVINTQADLERDKAKLQARCLSAEGQLEELNEYMKKSTISYQTEIMRLRTILAKHDPSFA